MCETARVCEGLGATVAESLTHAVRQRSESRIQSIESRVDCIESCIDYVESCIDYVEACVDCIETRILQFLECQRAFVGAFELLENQTKVAVHAFEGGACFVVHRQ